MAKHDETVPKEMSALLEKQVKLTAQRLFDTRKKMKEIIGPRPFMGEEIDSDAAFGKYNQMRNDPQAWVQLLQGVVRYRDGRVLLPNELIEATRKFEKRAREGEL